MNVFPKTYRLLSALVLMLFVSSVMLPATVSAATLLCGMHESTQGNHHSPECWNMSSVEHADDLSKTAPCSFQEICDQAISGDNQYGEAIPQVAQSFVIAFVLTKISSGELTAITHQRPQFEATIPPQNKPLFLLNSTFLN